MDLTETDWLNLWTYFWWATALPVTAGLFFGIVALASFIWDAATQ
ncbi:hypothetical protein ACM25O_08850 [Sulfitobacter pontiacus]